MERVQKLLSNYGYTSRRKAETLIKEGRVKVNNKTITIGDKASAEDTISVDGKIIKKERKVYIMFNKPVRCVTALKDEKYKTVMDYLKIRERIFPVGRLDFNTSGLLILTNDGDFANKIAHPSNEIRKTYVVKAEKELSAKQKKEVEEGIMIEGRKTENAKVEQLKNNYIKITIHEGRNRIIRKIFKKLDIRIKDLKRISIGKLSLGNLPEGKFRTLTRQDIEKIFLKK